MFNIFKKREVTPKERREIALEVLRDVSEAMRWHMYSEDHAETFLFNQGVIAAAQRVEDVTKEVREGRVVC